MSNGYLRSCAAGGGHHLGHNSRSFGGAYFCPRHLVDLMAGFNPQPNDSVRFIDADPDGWAVPGTYVVLKRDGDTLAVRRLGFPENPVHTVKVYGLYPSAGTHIHWRKGCGQ